MRMRNRIFRAYAHRAMLGIYFAWPTYHIYIYNSRIAVLFMWGSGSPQLILFSFLIHANQRLMVERPWALTRETTVVSNFSAKVVMHICYKLEWNAYADRMLNIKNSAKVLKAILLFSCRISRRNTVGNFLLNNRVDKWRVIKGCKHFKATQ